jgi:hypothetical protein
MSQKLFEGKTYNEKLFSGGLRGFFHNSRFRWLKRSFKKLKLNKGRIIELGCFDGRALKFIPMKPSRYAGYDANWEGGLDDALLEWKDYPGYRFIESNKLSTFNPENEVFDYSISMETLEHLYSVELEGYLRGIANATISYGFFSVPVEKGFCFIVKYILQRFSGIQKEPYTGKELWYATIGKLSKVGRVERGHKGFDYSVFIRRLKKHFDILEVKGLPFPFLPISMNFTVAIIAKKR